MGNYYKTKTMARLLYGLVLAITIFLPASILAQLNGNYTINAAGSGATNYTSWANFVSAINTSGVSGAVKVTVTGNHLISSTLTFNAISGVSATNTIEIDGNGTTLTSSGAADAILFNGADRVTIKNLRIDLTSTATTPVGIRFTNASDDNTITGVTIQYSARTSASTSAGAYIAFASSNSSLTTLTTTHNGSRNIIERCTMRTTNSNNPGPAYGIINQQGTSSYSSTASNNTFRNNIISNFYYFGIFQRYVNGDQFLSNDISRVDAGSGTLTSTVMYAIYGWYSYASNRSVIFRGNSIHDFPYAGASASSTTNYISTWYNTSFYYNYGSTTNNFIFDANRFTKIRAYSVIRGDFYYNEVTNIVNNVYDDIQTFTSGTSYMHYIYFGRDHNIENNQITNCSLSTASTGTFYAYYVFYCYNTFRTRNTFNDNIIRNNYSGGSFFASYLYFTYGSWNIFRNRIVSNTTSASSGYFYGLYLYYNYNQDVASNIIADNLGYFGAYHCYTYNFNSGYTTNFTQNTLRARSSNYSFYFMYGWVIQEIQSRLTFDGNITEIASNYYVYPAYLYNNTLSNITSVDNNTFFFPQIVNQIWAMGTSTYGNYNAWMLSGKPGAGNNYSNPSFKDPANGDYRSVSFETQNNVPTFSWNNLDRVKKPRQVGSSDRGAYEDSMDITASSTSFTIAKDVCAGFESPVDLTIRNTYSDTIYNFNVAYTVNGGTPVKTLVKTKILPGDSLKVKFDKNLVLPIAGSTTIRIYLDINDDNQKNNSFTYTTNVKPAPGGGKYVFSTRTSSPNNPVYQLSRPFDVTVINTPVYYDVPAPRVYNNATYGTSSPNNWYAAVQAYTKSGRAVTGASLTPPTGGKDLEVKFETADATLEDSTITLVLKVSDVNNGCDTFIRRNILVFPSATPDFKFPSLICDGSDVLFENKSNIKPSAALDYFWDFGTGVSGDTSNAPEPIFNFPKAGSYDVVLTAKTLPYGFVFSKKIKVTVNSVPVVDFTKSNACTGQDIQLTSNTTPSNANLTWDFGNGTTKTGAKITYQYPKAGVYNVKLKAELNGCVVEQTQRIYQFEKPLAAWTLKNGTCDNEVFKFDNTSKIGAGLIGSFWDFNDNGSISTDDKPTYQFSSSGTKNVKLTVISEFGCKDELTKQVEVRESPKANFTHTPACSLTPTEFTNTTLDIAGTTANYTWNFSDGFSKTAKDLVHSWKALGPKKVTLSVVLSNGCSSSVSKELNVLTQPKAGFSASDVCAGDAVVFVNNTTWPDGQISYSWDFGDGTYSGNSDPVKYFNVKQTTTYNVTLVANIQGGCADSITQRVIINEAPRTCDFSVEPDYASSYYGIKVNPLNAVGVSGGQANVNYTWLFAGVGTEYSNGVNASVSKDLGSDGQYSITMRAIVAQTGCECSITKKFVLNRAGMEELSKVGVTVFPNPATHDVKVVVSENFGQGKVSLKRMDGAELKSQVLNGNLVELNVSDLSSGIYLVEVSNGVKSVTKKLTVQK